MHKLIYLYNITITTTTVPVRRAWFMKKAQANECCVQFLHI